MAGKELVRAAAETAEETLKDEQLVQQMAHWEKHKEASEAGREMAERNLSRLSLEVSGQLQLSLAA